ncbi:MAG TPA: 3-hydroxybutyryl-CoA dehydrogenase [Chitinophagaceae bacterium]|nr:3-hydroxybutyryl-CoA dehydrogenase [Chitinophagaceae bacterium]
MDLNSIKKVAVIGAGTMGNGIAHVFAQTNYQVHLIDISESALQNAIAKIGSNMDRQIKRELMTEAQKADFLKNITTFTDTAEGVQGVDLVVEAATENLDLKLKIFKQLDEVCDENTILATNTSSISITQIAGVTNRPEMVIGMHFMNPVPVMKLVEIINGYATDQKVTDLIVELSEKLGKVPSVVEDYPGFIANRILMPMINEAILSLQEGVAGVEEIDTIMKLGMAHPMGPLQLADFIGLDTCLSILNVLHDGYGNPKYAPSTLLKNMVNAGHLGAKTGKGFYTYTKGSKELVVSDQFKK